MFGLLLEEVLNLTRENDIYNPVFKLANKIEFR